MGAIMKRNMGTTVALGLAFGAGIGAALHNIAVGVAVGLLFGAALGANWSKRSKT
jgi:F0F1-type ATP synthase membrane subunit c/vacuolar-type H+-ATPase subunit K